ncbi:MAG TPA: LamG-like jellyroll fold domain-containing protein [Myxococcus sp.]|nr:LamG-like jellyroll fold domain-containing protein [Myxococcus sp.]
MNKRLQVLVVCAAVLAGCTKQPSPTVRDEAADMAADSHGKLVPAGGLELWLRADRGVAAKDGRVARWRDLSGHGRDGIMDSAPRQPALVSSAVNGLPVVRFDGSQSLYLKDPVQPTRFTVFVVGRNTETEETFSMILGPGGNHPNNQLRWESGSEVLAVGTGNGLPAVTSTVGDTRAWHLLTASYDGEKLDFYMNGQHAGGHALQTNGPWVLAQVGAWFSKYYGKGELAEILVYSQVLPAGERASLESHFKRRYGLP